MYGYLITHEYQINRQAQEAQNLSQQYLRAIEKMKEASKVWDWDSPAADEQREKIEKMIQQATQIADELARISSELYSFTESHKTWLEELEDTVDNAVDTVVENIRGG